MAVVGIRGPHVDQVERPSISADDTESPFDDNALNANTQGTARSAETAPGSRGEIVDAVEPPRTDQAATPAATEGDALQDPATEQGGKHRKTKKVGKHRATPKPSAKQSAKTPRKASKTKPRASAPPTVTAKKQSGTKPSSGATVYVVGGPDIEKPKGDGKRDKHGALDHLDDLLNNFHIFSRFAAPDDYDPPFERSQGYDAYVEETPTGDDPQPVEEPPVVDESPALEEPTLFQA
ncbi:hypothetical protein [Streptomyces sp. NPDC048496]|uniref:hypothetical protein n=1 Tax=Streptomyces sp. NPDC048496 TaxID=3365558 RepID=UPI003714AD52